jgi:hypothetical protein
VILYSHDKLQSSCQQILIPNFLLFEMIVQRSIHLDKHNNKLTYTLNNPLYYINITKMLRWLKMS